MKYTVPDRDTAAAVEETLREAGFDLTERDGGGAVEVTFGPE